jgi:hypothetical protein
MPAEYHLAGRSLPADLHASREAKLPVRGAARQCATALQLDRQQRIGTRNARPGLIGETQHPEMIELELRGFQGAQYLHRNFGRFGLEYALACEPA